MRTTSRFLSGRRGALMPAALSGLLALAGCAGGGGGGGIPDNTPPVAFTYPASLADATPTDNVDGFISPYALNTTTTQLDFVQTTVFGTSSATGTLTITIGDLSLPPPAGTLIEPGFVVKFNPSDPLHQSMLLPNSDNPLGTLSTLNPVCADCLRTVTVQATRLDGVTAAGDVTFTYLDPTLSGLKYSTLGLWSKLATGSPVTWPEVGGAFSAGVLTRGIDLPTIGQATYNGYFIGRYATSVAIGGVPVGGTYLVGANAQAVADFSATPTGGVTFTTSHTQISGGGLLAPVAESRLDLTSTLMPISRSSSTSNSFAGAVGTASTGFFPNTPGQIVGGFYGPPTGTTPPPEAGGSLTVSNSNQSMVGSFAVIKTP